ncbi:MAG: hypothetical protein Q7R39_18395, partial [Dehalococcoidia bacterium]|nr:hypothetical protein [Dehalococcoidia bacterium]
SFDLKARKGRLVKAPFVPGENSMRALFAWLCVLDGGLLVHSCGVVKDGEGYLFFGHSGAGKSTVAGLSRQFTILSDDMVMVKKANGVFHACGVPFRGEFLDSPLTNEQAPLKGVFRLVKDAGHYLEPASRPAMVASLLASVPFMSDQIDLGERAAATCAHLLAAVPYGRLHFRRDEGFWGVIGNTSIAGIH